MDNWTKIRTALLEHGGAELSSWADFLGLELGWRRANWRDIEEGTFVRLMTVDEIREFDASNHVDWSTLEWDGIPMPGITGYATGIKVYTSGEADDVRYAWFKLQRVPDGPKFRNGAFGFSSKAVMVMG